MSKAIPFVLESWAADSAFHLHISRSVSEARLQALRLYRRTLKACPEIKKIYQVPISVEEMRKKLRLDFERHSHVDDPVMIDTLVLKGFNDLEEANGNFTFRAHIWNYFEHIVDEKAKLNPKETEEERLEREIVEAMAFPDPKKSSPRLSYRFEE